MTVPLEGARADHLVRFFRKLPKLRDVTLWCRDIPRATYCAGDLAWGLQHLTNLQRLNLHCQNVLEGRDTEEEVQSMIALIAAVPCVNYLMLGMHQFTKNQSAELGRCISKLPLEGLTFDFNKTGRLALEFLVTPLTSLTSLTMLRILNPDMLENRSTRLHGAYTA